MRFVYTSAMVLLIAAMPSVASPNDAIAAALEDARQQPIGVREQTRYLTLYNIPADMLDDGKRVLDFHSRQISRSVGLKPLRRVGDNMVAVYLPEYGFGAKLWERFRDIDPYFHVSLQVDEITEIGHWSPNEQATNRKWVKTGTKPTGKKIIKGASAPWLNAGAISELITLTQSETPILRADWWFFQTVRQINLQGKQTGVGYYDQLGLKNRGDLEKLIKLNQADSISIGLDMRAAVAHSGVSQNNRQVERLQALTGGFWRTLDTDDSTGAGNALANLARGEMKHKAERIYGRLPNGLPTYMLCDDKGELQPSAPDFIGPDDSPLRTGRDGRIHVGISCIRCHAATILRPIPDYVRTNAKPPLGLQVPVVDDKTAAKAIELERQYFSDLDDQLAEDRRLYRKAFKEVTGGWDAGETAKAVSRLYDFYYRPRGVNDIAIELGTTPARLRASMQMFAAGKKEDIVGAIGNLGLDFVLGGLLQNPEEKLRVDHWEERVGVAYQVVGYK